VLILGGGAAGLNAAKMALGLGAEVTMLDVDLARLRHLDDVFGMQVKTRFSEAAAIAELVREADLVIGAVLVPGKRAPQLLTQAMVKTMKPGSALVDIAIDQGGCAETSRPTTHSAPTYVEHGVVHYCVTNMPGAVARTATLALTQATLPLVLELADKGWARALQDNPGLQDGLNVLHGRVTHPAVAADLGYAVEPLQAALAA
jgi:alanine dehydrogenase